MHQYKLSFQ